MIQIFKRFQISPKPPQIRPRRAPTHPKTAPRPAKTAPRPAEDRPQNSQECPKTTPIPTQDRSWNRSLFCIDFRSVLGANLAPTWLHFGSQNGSKIDPKSIEKWYRNLRAKKCLLEPTWGNLKSILGCFCTHLGSKNHQKTLENVGSRENHDF